MDYSSKLEWEFLQEAIDLTTFKIINDVPLYSIKSCYLKRGENFEIILDITCNLDERNLSFHENTYFLGELILENYKEIFKLNYCNLKHKSVSVGNIGEYHFIFHVNDIERTYKNHDLKNETTYLKEWYLNSVHDKLVFTRSTKYGVTKEYVKIRNNTPYDNVEFKEEYFPAMARDYLFLTLDDFKIILQKVPDEFGPKWSNNLGIEYHDVNNIPLQYIRKKTADMVSFLLGRNLIKIGETYYDSRWNVIGGVAISPNISSKLNLKTISNYRDLPAISYYDGFLDMFDWEIYSGEIINAYLKCDLDLSHVLENLLMSMCLPTEAEIIIIGGCLDEISNKWFKSDRSPSKGKEINAKKFKNLISKELKSIEKKLHDYPQIYKKIENSHSISGRKRVNLFLKEAGIKIGEMEEEARNSRNKPAHGHIISGETKSKLVYVTYVYRSFLNRIILKILGFHSYYDLTNDEMKYVTEKISKKDLKDIKEYERLYYEYY